MNALEDEIFAKDAYFEGEYLCVVLEDDRIICIPFKIYPRLANGTEEQRNHFEIGKFGIHWPDLDEDLSTKGMLAPKLYVAPGSGKFKPYEMLKKSKPARPKKKKVSP